MESTSSVAIGIDLGTLHTRTAVYKDGRVEVIPNRFGSFLTPSWVAYTDQEILIGEVAKKNVHRNVQRTLYAIKRLIGRQYKDPVVQEAIRNWKLEVQAGNSGIPKIEVVIKNEKKDVYPEEVSGLLLREMKEIAEEYLGVKDIRDAVITVPAYFNDHQRQATKDAAKIAGLNVLRLINEPTAAAIAYIYDKPERKEHNVLVYDLGGGTFDVSIVSLKDCTVHVRATRGDTNLGGTNFDERCITHFIKLITAKYNVNMQDVLRLKLRQRLRNAVENTKHDLATSITSTIEVLAIYNDVDLVEELTRARFNDLNEDLFKKTLSIVEQCITEAKLEKNDIDDIVLVGGSTRICKLQEMLYNFFGKPASKAINPDHAVAHRAAILAAKLSGTLPLNLTIMDVTPMSLGIEIVNGDMNILIKRNTQIPTQAQKLYTTGFEDGDSVRIIILEGNSRYAKKNLKLGYFDLVGLPKNPSVNVTFKVDIDGIVTVSAEETSSGISKTINVYLNKGRLSDKEISILRVNSNIAKDTNTKWKKIEEKRNEFESFILQLRDDVTKNKFGITNQQQTLALRIIDEAFSWMTTQSAFNAEQLEKKQTSISSYCEMLRPNKA